MKLADHPSLAGYVASICAVAVLSPLPWIPREGWWSTAIVVPLAAAFGLAVEKVLKDRYRTETQLRLSTAELGNLKLKLAATFGDNPTPERTLQVLREKEFLEDFFRQKAMQYRFHNGWDHQEVVFSGWQIGEAQRQEFDFLGSKTLSIGQVFLTVGGNVVFRVKQKTVRRNGNVVRNYGSCCKTAPLDVLIKSPARAYDEISALAERVGQSYPQAPVALSDAWKDACANYPPLAGHDIVDVDAPPKE